jgi:predicted nucleic acid-binding protein
VRYLLDVSALVPFGFIDHEFHQRVGIWARALASPGVPEFATCSITELGFVRILVQTSEYGLTVAEARSLLVKIKAAGKPNFTFISDDHDISQLPGWVSTPKQITDGHLVQLAKANGAVLATLDRKIPGAFVIPPEK